MVKILTVEVDHSIEKFIYKILEEGGYEIIGAQNGDEVFAQLEKHPDTALVLLDIMLPKGPGWNIFTELHQSHPELKVVFVSPIEVSNERRTCLQKEGLAGYLVKPFAQKALMAVVKKALNKK